MDSVSSTQYLGVKMRQHLIVLSLAKRRTKTVIAYFAKMVSIFKMANVQNATLVKIANVALKTNV